MSNANSSKIASDLSTGLAALIWWELSDTGVSPTSLRSTFAAAGYDPSEVPDVDPIAGAKRAAREWSQGRGNATRYRTEVVAEEHGLVVVGLLRREKVADQEARWVQVAASTFDAALGWSAPVGVGTPEEIDLLGCDFRILAVRRQTLLDHHWIRPWIQGELRALAAFRLRRQGGVEVVPAGGFDAVEKLRAVVASIGDSSMQVAHVAPTEQSRLSLGSGARESVGETVADLRARIDAWKSSARSVRFDSAAHVLGEFAELSARCSMYEDALAISLSDLREEVESAKAEALRLVLGEDELAA